MKYKRNDKVIAFLCSLKRKWEWALHDAELTQLFECMKMGGGHQRRDKEKKKEREKISYIGSRWENAYSCGDLCLNLLLHTHIHNLLGAVSIGLEFCWNSQQTNTSSLICFSFFHYIQLVSLFFLLFLCKHISVSMWIKFVFNSICIVVCMNGENGSHPNHYIQT